MTLGWLIGGASLAIIVLVVALAVLAERWPWLRRLFADHRVGMVTVTREAVELAQADEASLWRAV